MSAEPIERILYEALKKARVAIATWSPSPDEPLQEINAALAEYRRRLAEAKQNSEVR